MNDLSYPFAPGHRPGASRTSRDASASVARAAKDRSALALAYITEQGFSGATADEVAAAHEWERYSSRPRLAELHKRKAIIDSGRRREGVSGRSQAVWVVPQFGPHPNSAQGDLWGAL